MHQPAHDAEDHVPQRAADDHELQELRRLALGDDLDHHDQDHRRGERLGDRVDGEEERVRPVRLDRPAQADGGAEAAPCIGEGEPADGNGSIGHCHRSVSLPSLRARCSR